MALDPFVHHNPVVAGMEQARARREQTRENAARLAKCFTSWTTTGIGSQIVEDVFDFTCNFADEPSFTSGWALGAEGPDLDFEDLPTVSTGVYEWNRDARGLYIGAWVFFAVTAAATDYVIHHSLTFEAVAIKVLPLDQLLF